MTRRNLDELERQMATKVEHMKVKMKELIAHDAESRLKLDKLEKKVKDSASATDF